MHQPRPYGLLSVGGVLTDDDASTVDNIARRLTNLKNLSGVESLRMVRTLPDGGYVIIQDMGGNFRVITHKPEPAPAQTVDGYAKDFIPMLFSGVILKSIVKDGEGVRIKISEGTRRRLVNYDPDQSLPADTQSLFRFVIEYNPSIASEFMPQDAGSFKYTQYVQQRPTWYSGAMAQVMQIVGGYGKQVLSELPDDPVERARMLVPQDVLKKIQTELDGIRLPGFSGLPDRGGQFQYDYKYADTDLIGFDDDKNPWLIRVSQRGAFAMPMPLIPATTTTAFREYMEKVGDDEINHILERFGGMPSGEGFPAGSTFDVWKRAGVIVKLCDTQEFYQHIAYYSACGWSINESGNEAYNTCYDYYDEEGLAYGLTFKMKLGLRAAENRGWMKAIKQPSDPIKADLLNAYLAKLFQQLGQQDKDLAIKYKIRRVDISELLDRAQSVTTVDAAEIDYWDRKELEPLASHSCTLAEVGRGYLYHGAKAEFQPQIKFPEPFMGGCVSFNFLPLINGRYKESYPNSDTVMFAYYIGDDLHVIKFFRTDRSRVRDIEDDYDECMTVGQWQRTATEGASYVAGNFYTTDIDKRQEIAPTTIVTKIKGEDKGYDSQPYFAYDAPFWRPGILWRNRYFTHATNIVSEYGKSLNIGTCIPYFNRNAMIHAFKQGSDLETVSDSLNLYYVTDPYTYRYWTDDFIFAWNGGLPVMNGKPKPKDGFPVWVEMEEYHPSPCSDFADQGPWIPNLPADFTQLIHPNRMEWKLSGGGGPPVVKEFVKTKDTTGKESGDLQMSLMGQSAVINNKVPAIGYFLGSPNEFGDVFYRDACKVVMGEAEYGNVSESATDGTPERKRFGFCRLVDNKAAHHFIGVING